MEQPVKSKAAFAQFDWSQQEFATTPATIGEVFLVTKAADPGVPPFPTLMAMIELICDRSAGPVPLNIHNIMWIPYEALRDLYNRAVLAMKSSDFVVPKGIIDAFKEPPLEP